MSYTIEDFKNQMSSCQTPDEMRSVIETMLNSDIDISNPNIREMILEYRAQIEDYRRNMNKIPKGNHIEKEFTRDYYSEDNTCKNLIESGKCDLYLCKKDIQWWKSGNRYYVIKPEVINSMKPLFFVISDDGIGTLKSRHLFNTQDGEIFEDYFEKI